jgi:hypothetical protein
MHIYIHTHTHIHIHIYMDLLCVNGVCVCVCVCVCTCMHTCIYYICTYMCIRVCMCIYRCYTSMPFDSRTPRHYICHYICGTIYAPEMCQKRPMRHQRCAKRGLCGTIYILYMCIYRCCTSMPFDSRTPRHISGAIGPTSPRYSTSRSLLLP